MAVRFARGQRKLKGAVARRRRLTILPKADKLWLLAGTAIITGAVMFPIAFTPGNIDGRRLLPDDIAGVSDIYPDSTFRRDTGSISGRVTKGGLGVFGAHIVAMHLRSGALVGTFTLDDSGSFVLAGVEPGPVVLRVEPLDDADVSSFIESARVDADFRVAFSSRAIFVPRGGNLPDVEITVVAK